MANRQIINRKWRRFQDKVNDRIEKVQGSVNASIGISRGKIGGKFVSYVNEKLSNRKRKGELDRESMASTSNLLENVSNEGTIHLNDCVSLAGDELQSVPSVYVNYVNSDSSDEDTDRVQFSYKKQIATLKIRHYSAPNIVSLVEDEVLSAAGPSRLSVNSEEFIIAERAQHLSDHYKTGLTASEEQLSVSSIATKTNQYFFQRIKEQGDKFQRYLLRNTRLGDVNKRLKAQIWSSVVTIVLVEAKNLPVVDLDSASTDPYCKFRLGNEKFKSKVVWKSVNPTWLEQFDLHLYDDQEHVLEVTVWDKTKDELLGRCAIDLSRLERETTHNLSRELMDGSGTLFLLLTISGTTQSETITDLTTYRENPREMDTIQKRYVWYRLNENNGVGWLCVKVYSAKGLAAADLGGKSDPFCVLELGNARLQTHTEYKTLAPNWMKIFTFTVKDITSILEVTVFDEDHDHKVEFLGKLAVPLLNIRNGEKRWYSLKDKKMRVRAKGNYPQILLEMYVIWNPLKAAYRAVNPKEPKYMHQESKFKRQLFVRNVMRLKSIIMWFLEVGKILQNCFEWESKFRSFVGLVAWLVFCYHFRMWMIPVLILAFFGRNWLVYRLTGGNPLLQSVDDDNIVAEEDDDDPEADKEEKKSLKERLLAVQEVTQTVQNAIGYVASLGEAVKNLFNFTVPYLSYLAIIMLVAASVVLFMIPLRYLLMAWGVNKFTRKILRPHSIPNNEILDLLSRVPDDETLLDCRELKLHNGERRDGRKKHKAS